MVWRRILTTVFLCAATAYPAVSCSMEPNVRSWEWGPGYVLENDLVRLSVLPDIGGRPMDYTLKSTNTNFLYHQKNQIGPFMMPLVYMGAWAGGLQTWPGPQRQWSSDWPPPAQISNGTYSAGIVSADAESVTVAMMSPPDTAVLPGITVTPGLRLRKLFTLFDGSSRVRIEHRLMNESDSAQDWALRLVAQCWNKDDYTSMLNGRNTEYRAYFPRGVSANDGDTGYWRGENFYVSDAGPAGVLAIDFSRSPGKGGLNVHPDRQWLVLAENETGKMFVQKAAYRPDGIYPEGVAAGVNKGCVMIVYQAGAYYELELCAPQSTLAPGDSMRFVTEWYMTTLSGPIADVNECGVIKNPLALDAATGTVSGTYGLFYTGTVTLMLGGMGSPAAAFQVSPNDSLKIAATVDMPEGISGAALHLHDGDGRFVGALDTWGEGYALPVVSAGTPTTVRRPGLRVTVYGRDIRIHPRELRHVMVCTIDGRVVESRLLAAGRVWQCSLPGSGMYTVASSSKDGRVETHRLVIR